MINVEDLELSLLNPQEDKYSPPAEFRATVEAHGLYNTLQFVLRLSPRVHELIDAATTGENKENGFSAETIQAYSTYLHETVHWWQHIGSTAGLVLSMSYPGQTHASLKQLREVVKGNVLKKPLKRWADEELLASTTNGVGVLASANIAINNALDIEFYKIFAIDPNQSEELFNNQHFECVGHSYSIAYGHLIGMLAESFDENYSHFPDMRTWDNELLRLRSVEFEGFYHGSTIRRGPVGLHAIFEGQARFIQLQFLSSGSASALTCNDFRNQGFLSGVYVEAFESFLSITQTKWPSKVDDPLIGLFLLICDISINPTRGFPLPVVSFEDFILDVDPGIRFGRLCRAVIDCHPEVCGMIINYSRDEYIDVAELLTNVCGYDHPLDAAKAVIELSEKLPALEEVMSEYTTFRYHLGNLPVRLIFSHFISFSHDKLAHPEFFCWAGIWKSGERISKETEEIFLRNLSLFADKADDDGIFIRNFPGKDAEGLKQTYNAFYGYIMMYDLAKQWILGEGPFTYDYEWLTQNSDKGELEKLAKEMFEATFGIHPDEIEILK
jgi:hypothetical protein